MDPQYSSAAVVHDPVPVSWASYDANGPSYPDLTGLSVSAGTAPTPSPPAGQPQLGQQQSHFQWGAPTSHDQQQPSVSTPTAASNGWQPQGSYEQHPQHRGPPSSSSRSTPVLEKSLHSKRSLSVITPLSVSMEETGDFDHDGPQSALDLRTPGGSNSYGDDQDMHQFARDMLQSPDDGHGGGPLDHSADDAKPMDGVLLNGQYGTAANSLSANSKPHPANNFVSKLYQMITDPKAAQYITWTELGTSFVVSSVGEFSRTILGSHFKHNNFSSFVRQLNMYGFHKINRTPRAQRTSTDQQVWEFSHHKFLRGRPDLLEDIKRKAMDTEPATVQRQRVELPADVAHQLGRMSEEYRTVVKELQTERAKVERLTSIVKTLYDVMTANFPGQLAGAFPADLLESHPPIYVTSAPDHRPQQQHNLVPNGYNGHALGTMSPSSSPTSADFPPAQFNGAAPNQVPATGIQARRQLIHRVSFDHVPGHSFNGAFQSTRRPGHESAGTTLPSSPSGVSSEEYGQSPTTAPGSGPRMPKRQRTNETMQIDQSVSVDSSGTIRRMSRARSDSAPLGYGMSSMGAANHWEGGRPRSGSTRHGPGSRAPSIVHSQAPPQQTHMDFSMSGLVNVPQLMPNMGIPPPLQPSMMHVPSMKEETMGAM